jgi:hypothetical protein
MDYVAQHGMVKKRLLDCVAQHGMVLFLDYSGFLYLILKIDLDSTAFL